ncbi:MAG: serine hydrolase [Actinomycetales bacterium]|nr:serine hydrolase [Actinomycetales bacterium]
MRGSATRSRRGPGTIGAVAILLLAAGCSTGGPADSEPSGTDDQAVSTAEPSETDDQAVSTAEPSSSGPVRAVDLGTLDGALREQTQWVLDHLAPGASGPAASEVEERFHPDFLAEVPADQVEPVLAQFREGPPLTLTGVGPVQEQEGARSVELTLSGEQPLRVTISVGADGLIGGLLIQPGPPPDLPEFASWGELDEEFTALGGTTRLYVGDVADGSCTTAYGAGNDPAPSGSVFKLLVLSAVVEAVEAGELAWDEELTITAEVKSLPSGELQDRPDGSAVTVEEAAGLMVAISDNTATDLLMEAVGPDRLSAAVARVTDEPERLTPLLSTSEFFRLGWDAPQVRERWADAAPDERVALLEELPADLARLRANPFAVSQPAWPDGVDWFLTGEEVCTAHAVLQQQAQRPAGTPVRGILSANPGLPRPDAATYQGFKGGSAPGVLAYTFYLESADDEGGGRVLSVQVSHTGAILPGGYTDLTQAALARLAGD